MSLGPEVLRTEKEEETLQEKAVKYGLKSPEAREEPTLPGFINKVLLKHSSAHLLAGCFCIRTTELSGLKETYELKFPKTPPCASVEKGG